MKADAPNPYDPPKSLRASVSCSPLLTAQIFVVPPALAIGSTLFLWVALVTVLDRRINHRWDMLLWSATLIVSLAISTYFINRMWSRVTSAFAFGFGFMLFAGVYCWLEGDTSNGTNRMQALVVYGTLIASPVIAFVVTWTQNRMRDRIATPSSGEQRD